MALFCMARGDTSFFRRLDGYVMSMNPSTFQTGASLVVARDPDLWNQIRDLESISYEAWLVDVYTLHTSLYYMTNVIYYQLMSMALPGSDLENFGLVPIEIQHDRSPHGERQALRSLNDTALRCSQKSQLQTVYR